MWYKNICSVSFSFVTIHACDRRTDGQTDRQNYDSQDHPRICSRGKNVEINHVLPLKATRRDAIANLKCFWSPEQPNVDGFIYILYAAPPYSARISTIYFLWFGKVWLGSVCRVQRLATKQKAKFTESG